MACARPVWRDPQDILTRMPSSRTIRRVGRLQESRPPGWRAEGLVGEAQTAASPTVRSHREQERQSSSDSEGEDSRSGPSWTSSGISCKVPRSGRLGPDGRERTVPAQAGSGLPSAPGMRPTTTTRRRLDPEEQVVRMIVDGGGSESNEARRSTATTPGLVVQRHQRSDRGEGATSASVSPGRNGAIGAGEHGTPNRTTVRPSRNRRPAQR